MELRREQRGVVVRGVWGGWSDLRGKRARGRWRSGSGGKRRRWWWGRAGDVCCSDKQMERTRRQRPANNSTGGHSFSTTVCRAANQLQRFCRLYKALRGMLPFHILLASLSFPPTFYKEATAAAIKKTERKKKDFSL